MSHPIDDNAARPETRRAGALKTAFVSLMILVVGGLLIWLIFKSEPTATRSDPSRETAMLVDVQTAEQGRFYPAIEVMGQVTPAREVTLRPRIGGLVLEQAEAFTPGGRVGEGETLLRIDPADYQTVVQQRSSELQQALADLELEQGRQAVARQEFELLGEQMETGNQSLILRKPQLEQARARVESARAALNRAELDLRRTTLEAPFDAQVLSREVVAGSQVNPGDPLARLVATDRYWVEAAVPVSKLHWLDFADQGEGSGAPVTLYHETSWPEDQSRKGHLSRLVGELAGDSRLARVIVTVDDPLALEASDPETPRLILGAFLRTEIQGRPLEDVVRLERDLIRRNNTVWVMEDSKLSIRDVEIAFRDSRHAYIRSGVNDGDLVVTNDLATVVDGVDLRREVDEP